MTRISSGENDTGCSIIYLVDFWAWATCRSHIVRGAPLFFGSFVEHLEIRCSYWGVARRSKLSVAAGC